MKKIFIVVLLSLLTKNLKAQNVFPPNGNVGIGTTNPTGRLTIGGGGSNINPNNTDQEVDYSDLKLIFRDETGYGGFDLGGIKMVQGPGAYVDAADMVFSTAIQTLTEKMRITGLGYVGLGTGKPGDRLEIAGTTGNHPGRTLFGDGSNYSPRMTFLKWAGFADNYYQTTIGNSLDDGGSISFQTGGGAATIGSDPQITRMIITQPGNVGIGTTTPGDYKLAVNGSLIATSVTVKLYSAWPDFVFRPSYNLKPLSELKTYIDQNHHLPEFPSASEVEKDGLNVGEMNKLLLKKVEELTLYLIEKDKENKHQAKQLEQQQKAITLLNEQVKTIAGKLKSQ